MKHAITQVRTAESSLKKRQRGMTLIELTLVLVLGGLVIFGALSMFRSANQSSAVSNETKNVQSIIAGVRALYPGQTTYTGVTQSMLITANKVPTVMVNGTNLRHSWNDAVTVAVNATAGFDITYANVPTAACIELVAAVANGFNTVTVGSTQVKAANANVNQATTATACAGAAAVGVILNSL